MGRHATGTLGPLSKGALAGAIGVWAMDRVGNWMYEREPAAQRAREERARPRGLDPTRNLVHRVASASGAELTAAQTDRAADVVHYALGVIPGALYGLARARRGGSVLHGATFGSTVFAIDDEVLNTALGLAGPPQAYPWQAHARGFVTHVVYGVVTDLVLGLLDRGRRSASRAVESASATIDALAERPDPTLDTALPPAPLAS